MELMDPLIVLLESRDLETQKAASLAISNLTLYGPGKTNSEKTTPTMYCFQWDILYRWSCGVIAMKRNCKIGMNSFRGMLHHYHPMTFTKYFIGSSALWEVLLD